MKYLLDAQRMKTIDNFTIQEIGIPEIVLMEKAAMAVAKWIEKRVTKKDFILAICGTGNNGGDGIAIVRILKEKGYKTAIYIIGDEKKATDSCKIQLGIARKLKIPVFNKVEISEYNIIVDALFGIGLSKPISGIFETVIQKINESENIVFSVDIPSGVSTDTGKVMNIAVKADYTITFGVNKKGLVLFPGCKYAGKVVVEDIGFAPEAIVYAKPDTFTYDKEDLRQLPVRKDDSNKGTFGKVLIIAGSKNMSGASYLAAKAAYRMGAGLVKILTVEDNRVILQTSLPEALLKTYNPGELKDKSEIEHLIEEFNWATSIVVGPGIGTKNTSEQLLKLVLENAKVSIIFDADALNILAKKENAFSYLPDNVVLTPHLMEMARLLHCEISDIKEDIINTAIKTVEQTNRVLVLKDARTVVTDGKQIYLNTSGNNGMATGGSGDVLTGIIAALLAQGLERFQAATLGVYLHGLAADYVAKKYNQYSLMASDIIEALPIVLQRKE